MDKKDFFRTILLSLNPASYKELSQTKLKDAMKYFLGVLLIGFLLMCLLFIPKLLTTPQYVYDELGSFESLDINVEHDVKEPIVITKSRPVATIDLTDRESRLKEGNLLVTEDYIEYRILPFTKPKRVVTTDMSNVTDNRKSAAVMATAIFILLLPAILLYLYILLIIKFILIILIATVLVFVIARLAKLDITFGELLKIALYASTIMIAVEFLTKPFIPKIYYIHYALFGLLFIAGAIKAGEFVPREHTRAKKLKQ